MGVFSYPPLTVTVSDDTSSIFLVTDLIRVMAIAWESNVILLPGECFVRLCKLAFCAFSVIYFFLKAVYTFKNIILVNCHIR